MKLDLLSLLQSCRIFVDSVLTQPNLDPVVVDQGKELYSDLIDEIQKVLYQKYKEQNDDL